MSAKQREYRRNATRVWNVKTGATRSGKTYGDYFLLPGRLLAGRGKEGLNILLGSTKGTLTRNVILPMQPSRSGVVGDILRTTPQRFSASAATAWGGHIRPGERLRGAVVK
jgi:hypothetical protein